MLFSNLVFMCALIAVQLTSSAHAIPLKHAKPFVKGENVGIFIATFDPPSFLHDKIMRDALNQRKFTRIVAIPTDFTPHKPHRTDTGMRHAMLRDAYEKDDAILTIDAFKYGYPQSRTLINHLRNVFEIEFTSVVLEEDLESLINEISISYLLPTEHRIILTTKNYGLRSSTEIKKYFKDHPNFSANSDRVVELIHIDDLPLSLPVRKFIRDHKLYGSEHDSDHFGFINDFLWSNFIIPRDSFF